MCTQPRLAIIFRGKGTRISEDEKSSWHKDVDVYFQDNAWADTKFSVKWAEKTLLDAVEDVDRFSLFCDNLTGQTADEFKDAVSKLIGVCWYGLPNATDLWQVIDAGYAELLKVLIGQAQHAWLDDDQIADLWYGQEKGFTAKDRRILITHWGNAHNKLITPQYDDFRWCLFEKTGLLMTADGSANDKVCPEGLPGYQIPPPAILLDPAETLPLSNEVDPCHNEE